MSIEQNWVMATNGESWFAIRRYPAGYFSEEVYDPKGISGSRAKFLIKTPLTAEKARGMVDKLNGPRGELRRV